MSRCARIVCGCERRAGLTFAAIGVLFTATYLVALVAFPRPHGRWLDGDAIQYYAYARSLLFDGDLDFRNDYAVLYRDSRAGSTDNVWLTARTPTGRAPNMMSIGPALLWAPFIMLAVVGVLCVRPFGIAIPLDGFAAPFPLAAGLAGIAYATAGIYLAYRVVARMYAPTVAFWASLAAWLATSAVYYSLVSPAYSHATSLFAVSLFAYAWFATRHRQDIPRTALVGTLGGLAILVRWQDAVVLTLPLVELLHRLARREITPRRGLGSAAVLVAAAGATVLPQLIAWHRIYGSALVVPQGSDFMRWTAPALWQVLVSMRHGLFVWTPAVLPAVLGLLFVRRRDGELGWGVVGIVLLAVYVNACVSDWWAGEAFGARRFTGYTVFFALGLAAGFSDARLPTLARPGVVRAVSAGLIVYNLLFLLQYQLFMRGLTQLAPYPTTLRQIFLDRLTLPSRLITLWLAR